MPEKTLVPVPLSDAMLLGVKVEVEMSPVASSYANAELYKFTEHEALVAITALEYVRFYVYIVKIGNLQTTGDACHS